jgi:hypothetical protein
VHRDRGPHLAEELAELDDPARLQGAAVDEPFPGVAVDGHGPIAPRLAT